MKHDLDLTKVAQLATFTDADQQQLTRLKDDLAKDPAKAAAEELLRADNIATLVAAVSAIGEKTVDSALQNVWTLHRAAR
ncbi:MAG: hypothetical protein M3O50_00880 [Myxococcota bacterium]|nr:hypothetical protein [Myxococcota bacterium]